MDDNSNENEPHLAYEAADKIIKKLESNCQRLRGLAESLAEAESQLEKKEEAIGKIEEEIDRLYSPGDILGDILSSGTSGEKALWVVCSSMEVVARINYLTEALGVCGLGKNN